MSEKKAFPVDVEMLLTGLAAAIGLLTRMRDQLVERGEKIVWGSMRPRANLSTAQRLDRLQHTQVLTLEITSAAQELDRQIAAARSAQADLGGAFALDITRLAKLHAPAIRGLIEFFLRLVSEAKTVKVTDCKVCHLYVELLNGSAEEWRAAQQQIIAGMPNPHTPEEEAARRRQSGLSPLLEALFAMTDPSGSMGDDIGISLIFTDGSDDDILGRSFFGSRSRERDPLSDTDFNAFARSFGGFARSGRRSAR